MKILFAQDDCDYKNLLKEGYSEELLGVEFEFCENELELRQRLSSMESQPDILVVDAYFEAHYAKIVQEYSDIAIVLTSATYSHQLEKASTELGIAGYFPRVKDADSVAYVTEQLKKSGKKINRFH